MKIYTVHVAVTVEAYGKLKVQAKSRPDADRRVQKMIQEGEALDTIFSPEWDTADDTRVVDGMTEAAE